MYVIKYFYYITLALCESKWIFTSCLCSFLLTSFYTRYATSHFIVNFVSMVLVVLPKLPQFHRVRLFGINKY